MGKVSRTIVGGVLDVETTINNIINALNGQLDYQNISYFHINNYDDFDFVYDPGPTSQGELILDNYSGSGIIRIGYGQKFHIPSSDGSKVVKYSHNNTDALIDIYTGGLKILTTSTSGLGINISPTKSLHVYENTSTTDSVPVLIEQDGDGDAAINFLLTATQRWLVGIDNSDSDKFKISHGSTFNSDFAIDTSGNITMGGTLGVTGLISQNGSSVWPTQWTAWTPTVTASGSMTLSSTSIVIARYCQIGKVIFFQVYITTTTGGTASTAIRFTAPVTPGNDADNKVGGACWVIDTTAVAGLWGWNHGGAYFQCFKYDSSNFGLGAGRAVNVQAFYEV